MPKVRFTTSIASPDWSYTIQQEVSIGAEFTLTEIPAAVAEQWLQCGHVVPVEEAGDPTVFETAALTGGKERRAASKRKGKN